jgi:hypothetical protein
MLILSEYYSDIHQSLFSFISACGLYFIATCLRVTQSTQSTILYSPSAAFSWQTASSTPAQPSYALQRHRAVASGIGITPKMPRHGFTAALARMLEDIALTAVRGAGRLSQHTYTVRKLPRNSTTKKGAARKKSQRLPLMDDEEDEEGSRALYTVDSDERQESPHTLRTLDSDEEDQPETGLAHTGQLAGQFKHYPALLDCLCEGFVPEPPKLKYGPASPTRVCRLQKRLRTPMLPSLWATVFQMFPTRLAIQATLPTLPPIQRIMSAPALIVTSRSQLLNSTRYLLTANTVVGSASHA